MEEEREEEEARDRTRVESRDYESRAGREQRRQLLEESFRAQEEDSSLISKEHSLEYQSQTLESQSESHLLLSASLESLLRSAPDSWPGSQHLDRSEGSERSFKGTQYSPKERQDAQTQTEQETKSTQCSPEQASSPTGEEEILTGESPSRVARKYHQSPRREVETQTQGESKSVQCCLDELGGLSRVPPELGESEFDSPSRSERKESKSVQCLPSDIPAVVGVSRSVDGGQSSLNHDQKEAKTRKEVEVQTYQESKAIQCSDDELLDGESLGGIEEGFKRRQRGGGSSGSSSCGSLCELPTLVFVDEKIDMTVTHRDHDGNVSWSKHWGPERLVEIYREPKTSLGLSIVGGKVRGYVPLVKNKKFLCLCDECVCMCVCVGMSGDRMEEA